MEFMDFSNKKFYEICHVQMVIFFFYIIFLKAPTLHHLNLETFQISSHVLKFNL